MKYLSAHDFLITGVNNSEQDKLRVEELFRNLPQYPQTTRDRLREEFCEIVRDRGESIGCRNQAVSILAFSSKTLNTIGHTNVLNALLTVLNNEFLSGDKEITRRQRAGCKQCKAAEQTFLRVLLLAIIMIYPKRDWVIPRKVYELELVRGINIDTWFKRILRNSSSKNDDKPRFDSN